MRQIQDAYFRRAKKEGYFARSVYKLEAIDRKFKLFKRGDAVLDLGSSPGSWLQYIHRVVGEDGAAAGVDLSPVKPSVRKIAHVLQKDISLCTPEDFAPAATTFDAVVSDMAPKTTGIRLTDQARSLELCDIAWEMAQKVLKRGGHFVCKIFQSQEAHDWMAPLRPQFQTLSAYKPPACRDESFETFIVGVGYGLEPKKKKAPEGEDTPPASKKKRRRRKKGGTY